MIVIDHAFFMGGRDDLAGAEVALMLESEASQGVQLLRRQELVENHAMRGQEFRPLSHTEARTGNHFCSSSVPRRLRIWDWRIAHRFARCSYTRRLWIWRGRRPWNIPYRPRRHFDSRRLGVPHRLLGRSLHSRWLGILRPENFGGPVRCIG